MSTIINLTPHAIVWAQAPQRHTAFTPSGQVARVTTTESPLPPRGGLPVVNTLYGEVENLPAPEPDTIYLVSGMVLAALKGTRSDVLAPDTGSSAIRVNGQIVAVSRFIGA